MNDVLFLQPKEISQSLIAIGEKKATASVKALFIFGILAGIYISFGAIAATVISSGGTLDPGISKFLAGSVFSVGLMLVLIPGAELFTGNILMAIGLIDRRFSTLKLLRNWILVYLGNFLGALFMVWLIYYSGLMGQGTFVNDSGQAAIAIADSKISLTFFQAFSRGVLCNMLVCLAVIMCIASKTVEGKIFGIYFPIMTFILCGFEHSIANMYLIPAGLALKGELWLRFLDIFKNLIPVTIGNIIGGLVIVLLHPQTEKKLFKLFKEKTGTDPQTNLNI
ncbi:MAG: hypothetical protein A3J83_02760 [Elusimicrobia bacterium RIFOXYA2_FULL_40_6]|nr:MAG: hypothetical protein A3J83_02760 [Elusimicrobia bacterium RIFOXYA2_FULL_40_6]